MLHVISWPIQFIAGQALSMFAEDDFLVTTNLEGQGKAIVTRGGSFQFLIMDYEGYHYNDPRRPWFDKNQPKWQVLPNEPTQPDDHYEVRPYALRRFGLHWVGLPGMDRVHTYHQEWSELASDKKKYPNGIRDRDEDTQVFMLCAFPYVIVDNEARTSEGLPIEVTYLLTLQIVNPHIALFQTNDWLKQAQGYTNRVVRSFLGSYTWKQLLSETDEADPTRKALENFSTRVEQLSDVLLGQEGKDNPIGMMQRIGVRAIGAEVIRIRLTGPNASEYEGLTLIEFKTKQTSDALVVEAQAKHDASVLNTNAKAYDTRETGNALAEAEDKLLETYAKNPEIAVERMKYGAYEKAANVTIIEAGTAIDKASEVIKNVTKK